MSNGGPGNLTGPRLLKVGQDANSFLELDRQDPKSIYYRSPKELQIIFDGGSRTNSISGPSLTASATGNAAAASPAGSSTIDLATVTSTSMFVEYTEKRTVDAFGNTVGDFVDRKYVKTVPIGAQVLSDDGRTVSLRFAETLKMVITAWWSPQELRQPAV